MLDEEELIFDGEKIMNKNKTISYVIYDRLITPQISSNKYTP